MDKASAKQQSSSKKCSILVLDNTWQPKSIVSAKTGICLLLRGKARALDPELSAHDFDSWIELSSYYYTNEKEGYSYMRSPSMVFLVPSILVLKVRHRAKFRYSRVTKQKILQRDGYTCQYCGWSPYQSLSLNKVKDKRSLTMDHVFPLSKGGKTIWSNMVASCDVCNNEKGDRTLEELGWTLMSTPSIPSDSPLIHLSPKVEIPKEWLPFLRHSPKGKELRDFLSMTPV